jgi:hypothetical protein
MSAINVIVHQDAVHVVTDGASWYPNKTFGPAACKAWPLPHLNAVVAMQAGSRLTALTVVDVLNMAGRTYDELKSNALDAVCSAFAVREMMNPMFGADGWGRKALIAIAGWSETKGPDAFMIVRNETSGLWETAEVVSTAHTPGTREMLESIKAALLPNAPCLNDLIPERDGLAMIEVQRNHREDGSDFPSAGAFAQLTTVTQSGIHSKVLKRWPEEWGAPVVDRAKVGLST